MRPIDADALVEKFAHPPELMYTNAVADVIRSAPTVGGWISVEDRLPDKWQNVLSCIVAVDGSWKHVGTDIYFGGGRWAMITHDECEEMKITHWMPMPEPPKEDENA